jgi:predicted enzyme related to lactoylglutathione lyase
MAERLFAAAPYRQLSNPLDRLLGYIGFRSAMIAGCAQVPHPCWNYYIAVDSVAEAAGRTKTRGGQVLQGPREVPGDAWIVQARDPQGAAFAMISAKG